MPMRIGVGLFGRYNRARQIRCQFSRGSTFKAEEAQQMNVSHADCATTVSVLYIGHLTTVEPPDQYNHLFWDKYFLSMAKNRTPIPDEDEHLSNRDFRSSEAPIDPKLYGFKLLSI